MNSCCNRILNYLFRCCCICINLRKFCSDTYSIFFKNMALYIDPMELSSVYDSVTYTFTKYNKKIKYDETRYVFFYKIHKVDCLKMKFYNYGYYYCVTNLPISESKVIENNELAYPPDTIEYFKLTMKPEDLNEKEYTLEIHDKIVGSLSEKFIGSILSFATKEIQLEILLYYYLQNHLNNKDKIINAVIKLELDDVEKEICISETLENIYSKLES